MSLRKELPDMRLDYNQGELDKSQVLSDPIKQFESWFEEAKNSEVMEANAMVLATASNNRPSQRVVLLKGINTQGFLFYTNYQSKKAREMAENPLASLCFHWDRMERQVRIEGKVEKISAEASNDYFQSRGRGSRIGAWASPQSQIISDREILEEGVKKIEKQFEGQATFPKPEFWGGYCLIPDYFEFWQGRSSRLHDRIFYQKTEKGWEVGRLAP